MENLFGEKFEPPSIEPSDDLGWVGSLDGKLYLYDPKVKSDFESIIILFDLFLGAYKKHNRMYAEKYIQKLQDQSEINRYEGIYNNWKTTGVLYPIKQSNKKPDQLSNQNRITIGRFTHCYNCKKSLSEIANKKCDKCGWIICPDCKACKCNYSR